VKRFSSYRTLFRGI